MFYENEIHCGFNCRFCVMFLAWGAWNSTTETVKPIKAVTKKYNMGIREKDSSIIKLVVRRRFRTTARFCRFPIKSIIRDI
ncbi:MAG: hypothetical protein ACLUKN_12350 [Bacilli bacterium]